MTKVSIGRPLAISSLVVLIVASAAADERPNVLLVMADDQGWGDVAYNGHPHLVTPNFDRASASGLRFDRFYAAAPVCSPTRASVMTGRHPNRMGCFKWGHSLRPQELTIAEALQDAGYVTGHFGKWHLGSVRTGSPVNPGASGFDHWFSAENFFDNDPILSREGRAVAVQGESSQITVDAAIEFMQSCARRDERFCCVVWFGSPHSPHRALADDRRHYAHLSPQLQHFYGEITAMDRAFGQLRQSLSDMGIRSNTLLWYTSDNGALKQVGSAGPFRGRKGEIYDGGLLVPAFLEWPQRIAQPFISKVRCNSSDIFPTILKLCDVQIQKLPPLDGVSLAGVVNGQVTQRPKPMGFWDYPARGISTPSDQWMKELMAAQQRGEHANDQSKLRLDAADINVEYSMEDLPGHSAWIDGDWKLHRVENPETQNVRFELYDLASDPSESRNVLLEFPERATQMKGALAEWQRSVVASLNGRDY